MAGWGKASARMMFLVSPLWPKGGTAAWWEGGNVSCREVVAILCNSAVWSKILAWMLGWRKSELMRKVLSEWYRNRSDGDLKTGIQGNLLTLRAY